MGVDVKTIKPGDGTNYPKKGDKLTMHYTGTLANGKKFDSSRDRNKPFEFTIGVGQVIRGWDEGVIKMSIGEQAKLTISPDFGYGKEGVGNGLKFYPHLRCRTPINQWKEGLIERNHRRQPGGSELQIRGDKGLFKTHCF